jgi:hypothetical protein
VAPQSDVQLRGRLLTQSSVPAGFRLMDYGIASDDAASAAPTPVNALPCNTLMSGVTFMSAVPVAAGAARIGVVEGRPAGPWFAGERLYSYPGDGAKQVLGELRSLVKRCPSFGDAPNGIGSATPGPASVASASVAPLTQTVALVPGPRLGDESVRLQIRETDSGAA